MLSHSKRWFPEHYLLCHSLRGDFQRIPYAVTFQAVIPRTLFVVPQFMRWLLAHSLWCHISRDASWRFLCGATLHAVISSTFFMVSRITRWFPEHYSLCHASRGDFQHIFSAANFHTSPCIHYNLPVLLTISAFLPFLLHAIRVISVFLLAVLRYV